MEVPRLGVQLELQLLVYTTATAMQVPSRICDLHHSSGQHWILNPLGEARDQTHVLMDPSGACGSPHGSTMGTLRQAGEGLSTSAVRKWSQPEDAGDGAPDGHWQTVKVPGLMQQRIALSGLRGGLKPRGGGARHPPPHPPRGKCMTFRNAERQWNFWEPANSVNKEPSLPRTGAQAHLRGCGPGPFPRRALRPGPRHRARLPPLPAPQGPSWGQARDARVPGVEKERPFPLVS